MHRTMLAAAMTVSLLVLGSSVRADDFSVNAPLTTGDSLPKKGSATYAGTFALSGTWSGVGGPVQLYVDFATGSVSASLTLPPLGTTPETLFAPTGVISRNGKKSATYTLTEGVVNSADQPFIDMNGSFSGKGGSDTASTLTGTICVPPCTVGGINVIRNFSGTFSATVQ